MIVRNFLEAILQEESNMHDGKGTTNHAQLFFNQDFKSNLRFINYTILTPGSSIGVHKHGNDEELYIVLEGNGIMTVDGEEKEVKAGDIILNKPFGEHGLRNNSEHDLKILVFEVGID